MMAKRKMEGGGHGYQAAAFQSIPQQVINHQRLVQFGLPDPIV